VAIASGTPLSTDFCGDFRSTNRLLIVDGAEFPERFLWLYSENDSLCSLPFSRTNFDAFSFARGLGTMIELTRAAGLNGHFIINDLHLWQSAMDKFIAWHL